MSYWTLIAPVMVAFVLFALMRRAPDCGVCGERLPVPRLPNSLRQAVWGGWTCPKCGAELNGAGEVVGETPAQKTSAQNPPPWMQ